MKGGQRCCQTTCNAQDSPDYREGSCPMLLAEILAWRPTFPANRLGSSRCAPAPPGGCMRHFSSPQRHQDAPETELIPRTPQLSACSTLPDALCSPPAQNPTPPHGSVKAKVPKWHTRTETHSSPPSPLSALYFLYTARHHETYFTHLSCLLSISSM